MHIYIFPFSNPIETGDEIAGSTSTHTHAHARQKRKKKICTDRRIIVELRSPPETELHCANIDSPAM